MVTVFKAGLGQGLLRGRQAVVHELVEAAGILGGNEIGDVEVLDLAGDTRRQCGNVEFGHGADAALSVAKGVPRGLDGVAHRRHETKPGNDYATG